jgi:hypothetical protein
LRHTAEQHIARMWELAWILEDHAAEIAMMSTSSPGTICYRDEFQVAAIPRAQLARFLG